MITVLRDGWPPGPWDDEPDRATWIDPDTGLPCMLKRTPEIGNLCGYVAVPPGHPMHGKSTSECGRSCGVHGGVTYTSESVSHGVPGLDWWIGFDCGHAWDLTPWFAMRGLVYPGSVYRTVAYVREQCAFLAMQLHVMRRRESVQ